MNSPIKSVDVVAIILEFVELQNNLIAKFRQTFSRITDWEYLLDCPRCGSFLAQGEEWKFQRHGVGVCFTSQNSGKVVDVHVGIYKCPKAFDAWRLCQYFDSLGIEKIYYMSSFFEVGDEDGSDDLLKCLLTDGLIAILLEQPKLYKLQ